MDFSNSGMWDSMHEKTAVVQVALAAGSRSQCPRIRRMK